MARHWQIRPQEHRRVPTRDGSIIVVPKPGYKRGRGEDLTEMYYRGLVADRFDEEDPYTIEVGGG